MRRQQLAGLNRPSLDGRAPATQLEMIRDAAQAMASSISATWEIELRPALEERAGIVISRYEELTGPQREELDRHFREQLYPLLTPLAVDPGHPFPFISNLSLSLGILMLHPQRENPHFARVNIPTERGRWLAVPGERVDTHFVAVEEVVRANVGTLFPGMEVRSVDAFRITRNADVWRDDEDVEDLVNFFHSLTGYAPDQQYRELLVAPRDLRRRFVEMIQELYAASRAGVPIDLLIRGHTRLRPRLPGYSESIRLVSIIEPERSDRPPCCAAQRPVSTCGSSTGRTISLT